MPFCLPAKNLPTHSTASDKSSSATKAVIDGRQIHAALLGKDREALNSLVHDGMFVIFALLLLTVWCGRVGGVADVRVSNSIIFQSFLNSIIFNQDSLKDLSVNI
jgi:hypothetical protein